MLQSMDKKIDLIESRVDAIEHFLNQDIGYEKDDIDASDDDDPLLRPEPFVISQQKKGVDDCEIDLGHP